MRKYLIFIAEQTCANENIINVKFVFGDFDASCFVFPLFRFLWNATKALLFFQTRAQRKLELSQTNKKIRATSHYEQTLSLIKQIKTIEKIAALLQTLMSKILSS